MCAAARNTNRLGITAGYLRSNRPGTVRPPCLEKYDNSARDAKASNENTLSRYRVGSLGEVKRSRGESANMMVMVAAASSYFKESRCAKRGIAWLTTIENSRRLMPRRFGIIRNSLGEWLGLLHTSRFITRCARSFVGARPGLKTTVIIRVLSVTQKNNPRRSPSPGSNIDVLPLIPFDWTQWTNNAQVWFGLRQFHL